MRNRLNRLLRTLPLWPAIAPLAHANVIWPALFVAPRVFSVPAVIAGLTVELLVFRALFSQSWIKAIGAVAAANAVSAIAGLFLIPILGFVWELFATILINPIFNWGTFNPISWFASYLIAMLSTAAIEAAFFRLALRLQMTRRQFGWWFLANGASVAVAFASLAFEPGTTSGDWYDPWPFDASSK